MNVYIVATNAELTYMVKAKSKKSAVSKAKTIARSKGIDWIDELGFEAYPVDEYVEDDECVQIGIYY